MKKRLIATILGLAMAASMALLLTGCDNPLSKMTYTPESKTPTISAPTIGVAGTLRVGVNTSNAPLAGQASKIVGIDVEVAAAIADEWGLKLEIVDVGTNPLTALQNGTVDLVLGIDSSNAEAAITKSNSYLNTGIAVFAPNGITATPTSASKIAVQSTSMSAWKVSSIYGTDSLVNTSDLKTAFQNLSNGTANYVAADAIIGTYAAYSANVDANIVALLETPGGYSAGTLATNTDLSNEVNTVLQKLVNNGTIAVIEKKWMGTAVDLSKVQVVQATTTTTTTDSTATAA